MVQTRSGGSEQGSGGGGASSDVMTSKLDAIMTKLKAIDTLQADMAILKAKDRGKGGAYEEGSSSYRANQQPRPFNKIEFPTFSEGDPRGWILKAEKYFRYYNIPEEEKVDVASMHLDGNALDLFSWLSADREIAYWEELVLALQKNFGPAEFENPDEYLCSIKQLGTVQEYRQEFAKRSSRVTGWPDKCLLGVFLNGLKEELKADVRIHKPRTVYKAMSIALEFESKLGQAQTAKNTAGHPLSKTSQHTQSIAKPDNLASHVPRISEAEKQVRFQKGECYRCGDKYSPGHRCRTGTLRILEVEEDQFGQGQDEPETEAVSNKDAVEISLHALVGTPTNSTLIIPGLINSFKVSVLIDCGSTHNFINDALLPKLGLTTTEVVSLV